MDISIRTVFVVEGLYDHKDGYRDRYVLGVYTSRDLAQRAIDKFLSLADEDEVYCARSTCMTENTLNAGWYEEYWAIA